MTFGLLMQKDYPSRLYQVTKGATTIWEHWDGIKEDGSFWSPNMNSFNHYAYGSIGDWLYRVVAGIDTDIKKAGFKHIFFNPMPREGLTSAKAVFQSMYGQIKAAWIDNGDNMNIEIEIPSNTTATVVLPFASMDGISESGNSIFLNEEIYKYENVRQGVRLELGSGVLKFAYSTFEYRQR